MYQPSTGMDHLGLASVSQDRILPALSPGINVLTVHPRYWSVYCWLLTEFWDRELPRTHAAWGRFLKPRERIFVAAVLSCPQHSLDIPEVAGKRRVGAEVVDAASEFDPTAPYLKNARGGYPIYASAISQVGLTILDRDTAQFHCDAPNDAGRAVAQALRAWVEPTAYYQQYFDTADEPVPADVVAEYSEKICLCRLVDGPDHPHVQGAFLHGGKIDEATRRRSSLRLVCDMSAETAPDPVEGWDFRQLIYYWNDDHGRTYAPGNDELITTLRRWRLYQLREFQGWACNRWLRLICRRGLDAGGDRTSIPLGDILASVDCADFGALATALGVDDPELNTSSDLGALINWVNTIGEISHDLDEPWALTAPGSEDRVLDHIWDLDLVGDDITAGIVVLMTSCALRLWPREHALRYAPDWPLVTAGGVRRLSVVKLVEDLRRLDRDGATIGEASRWILEHYVIRQHHRVALGKLPDDTFRLRLDAGRVQFVDEPVAVEMNDSRFRALSTCAAELGWTRPLKESNHGLTRTGRRFVTNGDLPAFPSENV
ncbi:cytochrome P450 [Rhabdothermincola salaria]|uniref:cytochrome P450 n=1 Tax=Rhabdothermincola salaria TaxID=2903142 RepID=UPI001E53EEE3|nr:cytochrome P450 [Rhabdothermincola salaria]MCD9624218.1 cytochrome P450 [Rhabdothermincola salaria]